MGNLIFNNSQDESLRESGGASIESDEALWQLLGRARRVEASPWFARKVMREIEAASQPHPGWWQLLLRAVAPAAACAAIAVLAIAANTDRPSTVASTDIEFETIQNLDLLVYNYESSLWLDPSSLR